MSDDEETLSPAEERVRHHLTSLRDAEGRGDDDDLARRVVSSARWQRAARQPLNVAGAVLAALGDGIRLLVGGR